MNKRECGKKYEEKSCEILVDKKYIILEKNYRNRLGEIDIIAKKDEELVFVEVKYRRTIKYGYGYEAINKKKLDTIFKVAQIYIRQNNFFKYKVRFDCMSYTGEKFEWLQNMTWGGDEIGF